MQQQKSKLPLLPSLEELEARAEAELNEAIDANTKKKRIIEVTCPLLEEDMLRGNTFSPILTPKVHIVDGEIICQRYERTTSKPHRVGGFFGIGGRLFPGHTSWLSLNVYGSNRWYCTV
ncbi:MAG TPA: hypothetical protein VJH37_01990 [Candidatus Nanoarchaeia archaeon]|nr:hypothetical protein [Candidatus Nanoarchaeia archaeon]